MVPQENYKWSTSSMIWTCLNWMHITLKPPSHFWDNTPIMVIGMICQNWLKKISSILRSWQPWTHQQDLSTLTRDIKDTSGQYRSLSLITNHYIWSTIHFCLDNWKDLNQVFKSKQTEWSEPLYYCIKQFRLHSKKQPLTSTMNST